jgi:predicted nucleic acid-binding protein
MRAVDTNILIYAHDPQGASKQQIAIDLIQSLTDGVLLWQVACEYLSAQAYIARCVGRHTGTLSTKRKAASLEVVQIWAQGGDCAFASTVASHLLILTEGS